MGYTTEQKRVWEQGLGVPDYEKSSCGVGCVSALHGGASHDVVRYALEGLGHLQHRGGIDVADGITGDGAGIHVSLAPQFFLNWAELLSRRSLSSEERVGVGMFFFPRTLHRQEQVRQIVEYYVCSAGYEIYGWRQVNVNLDILSQKAYESRPEVEQVFIKHDQARYPNRDPEKDMPTIIWAIEKEFAYRGMIDVYICSLSFSSIVYKGLVLPTELGHFYPDLLDPDFVSRFAIYHQRYSTNTNPAWALAQPFRILAHNGEITTLKGNLNRLWGAEGWKIFDPETNLFGSDTMMLDEVVMRLVHQGLSLWEIKKLLLPEAFLSLSSDFNGIHVPWDGPAALCFYTGHTILVAKDRNGLRPVRYAVSDEFLFLGSEMGIFPSFRGEILTESAMEPGEMLLIDLDTGAIESSGSHTSFRRFELSSNHQLHEMTDFSCGESEKNQGFLHHYFHFSSCFFFRFFRLCLSCLTKPPLDYRAWFRRMDMRTEIVSLNGVSLLVLDTPFLQTHQLERFLLNSDVTCLRFSCVFSLCEGDRVLAEKDFVSVIDHIVDSVSELREQCAKENALLIVLDQRSSRGEGVIPFPFVVSALHKNLSNMGKRVGCTLIVEFADALDIHEVAVLFGLGADLILLSSQQGSSVKRLDYDLRSFLSKQGISVFLSYRGSENFEILGLSRTLARQFFSTVPARISGLSLRDLVGKIIDESSLFKLSSQTDEIRSQLIEQDPFALLAEAIAKDSYEIYEKYSAQMKTNQRLLDLLSLNPMLSRKEDHAQRGFAESLNAIRKRFIAKPTSLQGELVAAQALKSMAGKSYPCEILSPCDPQTKIFVLESHRYQCDVQTLSTVVEIEVYLNSSGYVKDSEGLAHLVPMPHYDIYSVEDFSQLVHDLYRVNPSAELGVRLLSGVGIGHVAVAAVKAGATVISISEAPFESGFGVPAEIGVAEVNQILNLNGLRDYVKIRADGSICDAYSIVKMAALGADEFVIDPCCLQTVEQQCQDQSQWVSAYVTFWNFLATEVVEILERLNCRNFCELVGNTSLLSYSRDEDGYDGLLDLNPLLLLMKPYQSVATSSDGSQFKRGLQKKESSILEKMILLDTEPLFATKEKMNLQYFISNVDRAIGVELSAKIALFYGYSLPDFFLVLKFYGSAGQSFGAYLAQGVAMYLLGTANDFVGRSLSGGVLVIAERSPSSSSMFLVGDVALYGAVRGQCFIAGMVGQRFAVCNRGAFAVVEGCGQNACEFMVDGCIVILGSVGFCFASSMSGGVIFVYDPCDTLGDKISDVSLQVERLDSFSSQTVLSCIRRHYELTSSLRAQSILDSWDVCMSQFVRVTAKSCHNVREIEKKVMEVMDS